jgi:hypothetical protein
MEHLAGAEPRYWAKFRASLSQPLTEQPPGAKDDAILWFGLDRTVRSQTGEARVPHGQYPEAAAALAAFRALRQEMNTYVENSLDYLRGRRHPEGDLDLYQTLLMISRTRTGMSCRSAK